ncbi:MAG: lysophospholipid acyltransferase family protein [bacterium]
MWNDDKPKAFERQLKQQLAYTTSACKTARNWGPLEVLRAVLFHARILRVYALAKRRIRQGCFGRDGYLNSSWSSLTVAEKLGGRFAVTGLHHLVDTQGPVVIIGNHMGSLETIAMPCLILPFKEVAFVVKQSLTTHPIFGPIMCAVPHIAVARNNPREDLKLVLTRGAELLSQGVSVVIFPQATRSAEFDVDGFNTLGIKLAARAGAPVIPLALKTDFMANGKWIKDMGLVYPSRTIHFAFGNRIGVTGSGREEHVTVVRHVASHLKEWGGTIKGVVP